VKGLPSPPQLPRLLRQRTLPPPHHRQIVWHRRNGFLLPGGVAEAAVVTAGGAHLPSWPPGAIVEWFFDDDRAMRRLRPGQHPLCWVQRCAEAELRGGALCRAEGGALLAPPPLWLQR